MARMVRKQIVISPEQDRLLEERAAVLGVSQSALVRRAIDRQIEETDREYRMKLCEQFVQGALTSKASSGGQKWTREEIHERGTDRH
ncbi:MAG: ribbon-helix-helix protein, CopG family [Coriobacteriia bacterium]|nr:ribbon-helix-helix protein, CopG family [Coriobacteriia bacterium]